MKKLPFKCILIAVAGTLGMGALLADESIGQKLSTEKTRIECNPKKLCTPCAQIDAETVSIETVQVPHVIIYGKDARDITVNINVYKKG